MKFLTQTLTKKRERERRAKTYSIFRDISKTPENFSLVTLVTNHHKSSLLPLVVRPWSVTSNELYFHSLRERFKCAANKHRELNFCH